MNKYNEIMEHIELTEEMRERIIGNIAAVQRRKRFGTAATWITAAAACVVIAVGAVNLLNRPSIPHTPVEEPSSVQTTSVTSSEDTQAGGFEPSVTSSDSEDQAQLGFDVVEYSDIAALSEAFGVELRDASGLPFKVKERRYVVMFHDFAEIDYDGADGENCCVRIGKDTEDISGDYNEYDSVRNTVINGTDVTLKGSGGLYYLAFWVKDEHFWSVSLSEGADEQKITDIAAELIR